MKKGALLAVCFAVFFSFGCSKKMSEYEMIERGKYLAGACGVLAHHTPIGKDGKPEFNKFMAGSKDGYKGAWGVYYAKNLTPDNDTGIGMMTDEEVINMIKSEGANGKAPLYYDYYRGLTDDDLKSLVVYLRTLAPISNNIPEDIKPGKVKIPEKKIKPRKAVTKKFPAKKTTKNKK
ncbi:MAG: hypothetical protein V1752_00330 [Candidatus Firestonebacteria bacterium]